MSAATTGVPPTQRRVEHVMGLPISLALRGRHADDAAGAQAWEDAVSVLREADRVFSTYRTDSMISRFGRGEIDLVDCPPEVGEVLDLGENARQESSGAFNIVRPGPDGRPLLDPSGVVKGWAVDRAFRAFDGLDSTDVCLSAGGDLRCSTRAGGSTGWRIGIEDPHDPERIVATIPIRDGAIATSGLAHRGAHIVDPRTGAAPSALASVTVIGSDLTSVDIDATAGLVLGDAAIDWLTARGRCGVVVRQNGTAEVYGTAP